MAQFTIHDKLVRARQSRPDRPAQEDVAKALGIKRTTWRTYETGATKKVPKDLVTKLAGLWGIPVEWFWDGEDSLPPRIASAGLAPAVKEPVREYARQETNPDTEPPLEMRQVSLAGTPLYPVPVIGYAAAGSGEHNVDPDDFGPVYVPESLRKLNGRGWVVTGASMLPLLMPGDVALFREMRDPRPGYTYLLQREDGQSIKNIEWKNGQWTLVSVNADFPDEPLGGAQILGMLIGWYRAIGSRELIASDPAGLKLGMEMPIL